MTNSHEKSAYNWRWEEPIIIASLWFRSALEVKVRRNCKCQHRATLCAYFWGVYIK